MKSSAFKGYLILVVLLLVLYPFLINAQERAYTVQQLKEIEASLARLPLDINKIQILLNLSDCYGDDFIQPASLNMAFQYVNDALKLSKSLNSDIYTGKCYLQLSRLSELSNNNEMIEDNALKAER